MSCVLFNTKKYYIPVYHIIFEYFQIMDGPNNMMVADSNTFLVLLIRGTLHRIEQVTESS